MFLFPTPHFKHSKVFSCFIPKIYFHRLTKEKKRREKRGKDQANQGLEISAKLRVMKMLKCSFRNTYFNQSTESTITSHHENKMFIQQGNHFIRYWYAYSNSIADHILPLSVPKSVPLPKCYHVLSLNKK